MHASVFVAIRTVTRYGLLGVHNFRGAQAPPLRNFNSFKSGYRSENSSCDPEDKRQDVLVDDPASAAERGNGSIDPTPKPAVTPRMKNSNESKLKKPRSNSGNGLPLIRLPEWFLRRNVHCGVGYESVKLVKTPLIIESDTEAEKTGLQDPFVQKSPQENESPAQEVYSLNHDVYTEILATLRAGLRLRPPKNTATQVALRPITVLQCPKDGASVFLDHIVSKLSFDLGADLVQLDAQDIAQIVGPYLDENIAWNAVNISLFGYSAQKVTGKLEDFEDNKKCDQELDPSLQGSDESSPPSVVGSIGVSSSYIGEDFSKLLNIFVRKPRDNSRSTSWSHDESHQNRGGIDSTSNHRSKVYSAQSSWDELKASAILKAIVEAADFKRMAQSKRTSCNSDSNQYGQLNIDTTSLNKMEEDSSEVVSQPLIIQIKDYQELSSLDGGPELIEKLNKIIKKKWIDGRDIILVGTTEGVELEYEKRGIQILQEDFVGLEKRTIIIPSIQRMSENVQFKIDRSERIRKINIRHLEDMISRLTDGSECWPTIDIEKNLEGATKFHSELGDRVWTFGRVYRTSVTLLGMLDLNQPATGFNEYDGMSLHRASTLLSSSDEVKFAWGAEEIKECETLTKIADSKKISKLAYNTYEKKLLSGVVSPEKITTTFSEIRAPEELIEALKTLTSLSLTRPEAFKYGILRRDKIPGILLYGPPGTGKTLLAKAVAKESGATVLEVTAADLNNMYVGEGEKNVKALFTLAKKLSPCVVFIDEADSMFGSREGSRQRVSHREMINQFLREWDGISDFTGFIMVATNRPYDLDDAILRRLPRRLLVDLPLENDREEILKIHLRDEALDKSVSLSSLARNTPYYSGSDLKNLCVAAALACIREENDIAACHPANSIYEYPKKRILRKVHFDIAIEEISASINEDMSSLKAIKEFDGKYGDRKGRRKRGPGLGFEVTQALEVDSDTARVRPLVNV